MELTALVKANAEYVEASGYKVFINFAFSWVEIKNIKDDSLTIFLQGSDADAFIAEARSLQDKLPDTLFSIILDSLAYPYI